jgi:transcriptional regulator with XRE-family HTH domain
MVKNFGEYIKELRISSGLTLRDFSKKMELDAGNWSRVERGILLPPKANKFFTKLQKLLGLEKGVLEDLKALADSFRMTHKFKDSEIMEHMPVLFRRANGDEPTDKEIEHLVEWLKIKVKNEHSNKD